MMGQPVDSPYVGPRPFRKQDKDRFFGRDHEVSELVACVFAYRNVLLYAQSGAGKTSLLNARLIPDLEAEGFEVLPVARVKGTIPSEVSVEDISNLYVFSLLSNWTKWVQDVPDLKSLSRMRLQDFLKLKSHAKDKLGESLPRVLIFDQFEELFTVFPEHWEKRQEVFEQINSALEDDSLLRVLISMREDYIAYLDPYANLLPDRLRAGFRLERLREDAAMEAITQPAEQTGRAFVTEAADQLIEELRAVRIETATGETQTIRGEFIEPVQLQVVCDNLWRKLPDDVKKIQVKHVHDYGDVDQALSEFYRSCIESAAEISHIPAFRLHRWVQERFITPANTRNMVYRERQQTAGVPNEVLETFEELHLIRGEWRLGSRWYELTHDRFIEPIQRTLIRGIKIYLSYSRRDARDFAERLYHDLRTQGFVPWMDTQGMVSGELWSRQIEEQVEQSEIIIALISQGSYASDIIRAEQLRARRKGKRIIPILVQRDAEIPLHLEALAYLDFSDLDQYEIRFQQLVRDVLMQP